MMVTKESCANVPAGGSTRFPLGRVVATPAALRLLEACNETPTTYLARHAACDWGDVCAADAQANLAALHEEGRLLSAYHLPNSERLWIITECDRSVTTLLLPREY